MSHFKAFSLDEWLFFLENRHAQEIKLGLTRVKTVADRLGLCDLGAAHIITVAGTNGKGSTVACLEALYLAAGHRVGCYTSPHLIRFNERICINKNPISDESLCSIFNLIEDVANDIHLTYFEMATLAALYHFKQLELDVIILEVGIGGRLDATNIIDAHLAVITTIDFDHQDYLGDTIEAIAYEKAGILKPNQILVYGDTTPPSSITEQAALLNVNMLSLEQDYFYSLNGNDFTVSVKNGLTLKLPKPHINLNAAAAAIAATVIFVDKVHINNAQYDLAMKSVGINGRQQVVQGDVTKIFDVAHNPQAVRLLADFISRFDVKGRVHIVFSGLKDKDLRGLIQPMLAHADHWYVPLLNSPRAATEWLLRKMMNAERVCDVDYFSTPVEAYNAAIKVAEPGDIIVVYGSFLMVSPIMIAERIN